MFFFVLLLCCLHHGIAEKVLLGLLEVQVRRIDKKRENTMLIACPDIFLLNNNVSNHSGVKALCGGEQKRG